MKRNILWYGIIFLFFVAITIFIFLQNLTTTGGVKALWMTPSIATLILIVGFLGIIQGIFLVIFIRSFFTSVQKPELSKFDLDKPL